MLLWFGQLLLSWLRRSVMGPLLTGFEPGLDDIILRSVFRRGVLLDVRARSGVLLDVRARRAADLNYGQILPNSNGGIFAHEELLDSTRLGCIDGDVDLSSMASEHLRASLMVRTTTTTYLVSLDGGNLLIPLHALADAFTELFQCSLRDGLGHLRYLDHEVGIAADDLEHGWELAEGGSGA